jgi:hypothetical protein
MRKKWYGRNVNGNNRNFLERKCIMNKMLIVTIGLTLVFGSVSFGAIISDDFNRPDSANLGTTNEGYAWTRYNAEDPNEPQIRSNRMEWQSYQARTVISAHGAPRVKNFTLDMDVTDVSEYYVNHDSFFVAFRMAQEGRDIYYPDYHGADPGYTVTIAFDTPGTTIKANLVSDYDTVRNSLASGSISAPPETWDVHLTIIAQDSNIKVYLDGTKVIDYTDTTSNPAADEDESDGITYGYFAFNSNYWHKYAMDNLNIVPEPTVISLLCLGVLGLLRRK